ncbi:hypothetical protein WG922_19010 [Ramlibacter sp. AN1015]|uniref:hypothetical protein n=1 Tax=Ramlibacter sp. AN1015 TaxID=3133428 RepID=UPI0030C58BFB
MERSQAAQPHSSAHSAPARSGPLSGVSSALRGAAHAVSSFFRSLGSALRDGAAWIGREGWRALSLVPMRPQAQESPRVQAAEARVQKRDAALKRLRDWLVSPDAEAFRTDPKRIFRGVPTLDQRNTNALVDTMVACEIVDACMDDEACRHLAHAVEANAIRDAAYVEALLPKRVTDTLAAVGHSVAEALGPDAGYCALAALLLKMYPRPTMTEGVLTQSRLSGYQQRLAPLTAHTNAALTDGRINNGGGPLDEAYASVREAWDGLLNLPFPPARTGSAVDGKSVQAPVAATGADSSDMVDTVRSEESEPRHEQPTAALGSGAIGAQAGDAERADSSAAKGAQPKYSAGAFDSAPMLVARETKLGPEGARRRDAMERDAALRELAIGDSSEDDSDDNSPKEVRITLSPGRHASPTRSD